MRYTVHGQGLLIFAANRKYIEPLYVISNNVPLVTSKASYLTALLSAVRSEAFLVTSAIKPLEPKVRSDNCM